MSRLTGCCATSIPLQSKGERMVYTIENEHLTLSVDSMGAQMMHICSRDGRE